MNCPEDVTVELASDGMIVHRPASADVETESYVIRDASLYTDDRNRCLRPVPLSHLWLIWFGSLPFVAAIIYLMVQSVRVMTRKDPRKDLYDPAGGRDHRSRMERTMIVMQEVLSRPGESDKPINEQEYWTLELIDWTESGPPGFVVQQSCGRWSEIDRQFMFEEIDTERWPPLIEAEERYEALRLALVKKGFVQSDMEF